MPGHKKPYTTLRFAALTALLSDAAMKFVDIGGRGSAFPPLNTLASFAHYFVSEPDAPEAERLRKQIALDAPWRAVTVMAEAIAARRGEADLYVTRKPGMSSLLEPDVGVTRRFCGAKAFGVVSTMKVPTLPLDEAAAHYGFADAAFLKVDTQGTELEILQSGSRLVSQSLLGIHTESLFQPFYKGQSLFADVDRYLRQQGFALFSLSRTALRRSGYQESLYSRRVVTWAHCLYLREPETLIAAHSETVRRDVARLLGLALAFQHYDLAFEIAALARRNHLLADSESDRLNADLHALCGLRTRQIMRRAEEEGLTEVVLAASFRDKTRLE